jgi:hypothetical protein
VRRTAPLTVSSGSLLGSIVVDGILYGESPQVVPALSYGPHIIMVEKEGYEVWSSTITIPYPDNRITADLKRSPPGFLVLSVEPWADISVDGVVVRKNSQFYGGIHPAGPVTIEFVKQEMRQKWDHTVVTGDTLRVTHTFR